MANLNLNATTKSFAFAGSGAFYLADIDGQGNRTSDFTPMGLVDSASLTIEATNIEKYDASGGLNEIFSRLTVQQSAQITFTVSEISYEKIADFLFGTYSEKEEETLTDEPLTIKTLDALVPLKGVLKAGEAVVVKSTDDSTTYEEGKNYIVDSSAIYVLSDEEQTKRGAAVNLAAGDVKYDAVIAGEEKIAGFTKTSNKKAVYFQGRSLDDGKDWIWEGYKLSFEPMSALPFNSTEDYATYELTATLEKVSGRDSSFFELRKEK